MSLPTNFFMGRLGGPRTLPEGLASWPTTVIGYADPLASSFDISGSNYVGYSTPYDGRFINEWDVLNNNINLAGPNGAEPGNLTSNLSRSVPGNWTSIRNNTDRRNGGVNMERGGFALFVVGRDCPLGTSTINVIGFGGGGGPSANDTHGNWAYSQFSVVDGDTFRVCIGNGAGTQVGWQGSDGVGGGAGDGDSNGRNGGGGTGFWDVGISPSTSATNRFLIAGGGGNYRDRRITYANSNSNQGDSTHGTYYGLTPGNNEPNHHYGGGPGAGGHSSTGGNAYSLGNTGAPGAVNTGVGGANGNHQLSDRGDGKNGDGGGTGGNGSAPTDRSSGGAGGFAYNRVGLGGGGGQFGGGGGWQGGGGGWGDTGSTGTSFATGGNNVHYGAGPSGTSSRTNNFSTTNVNQWNSNINFANPYGVGSHGRVYVWW